MRKKLALVVITLSMCVATFASAQGNTRLDAQITGKLKNTQQAALFGNLSLAQIIGNTISVVLGVIGTIAIIYIIYGGFIWMNAEGNDEKLKKAATMMTNAALGLIIIMAAYGITAFVVAQIQRAAGQ